VCSQWELTFTITVEGMESFWCYYPALEKKDRADCMLNIGNMIYHIEALVILSINKFHTINAKQI